MGRVLHSASASARSEDHACCSVFIAFTASAFRGSIGSTLMLRAVGSRSPLAVGPKTRAERSLPVWCLRPRTHKWHRSLGKFPNRGARMERHQGAAAHSL